MLESGEAPLGDFLSRITYGFTNPMPTTETGHPMITARDINNGRILYESARFTSTDAYRNDITDKCRPEIGDVLVTKDGTLGRIAIVDRAGICINQSVALLKPSAQILSRFLKYLLEEPTNFARMIADADGTTIKHIYITRLAKMRVCVPPLPTQRRVVDILGSLDDKIELNRRMNETLEAIAQAIFRDWFVDFGPTRRQLAGATDPAQIMGGLTPDPEKAATLAPLFPPILATNGLPEGWEEASADQFIEFNPKEPLRRGEVAPYTDMASLPTKGSSADPPVDRQFGSGMRFRNGDALLARITPCLENGKAAYVDFLPDDDAVGWGSTEFIVLRSRAPVPQPFAYCLIRHPEFRDTAIRSMTGTSGRQRAQADTLKSFKLVRASDDVFVAFGALIVSWFKMIRLNQEQSTTLAAIRDLLLPKLMSGEIRLRDAERAVAEAAT